MEFEKYQLTIGAKYLEGMPGSFTVWEMTLLWCREVLRRNLGNRAVSYKSLGISIRALRGYIIFMRDHHMDVPESNPDGWKKPSHPVRIKYGSKYSDNRFRHDSKE